MLFQRRNIIEVAPRIQPGEQREIAARVLQFGLADYGRAAECNPGPLYQSVQSSPSPLRQGRTHDVPDFCQPGTGVIAETLADAVVRYRLPQRSVAILSKHQEISELQTTERRPEQRQPGRSIAAMTKRPGQ